MDTVYLDNLNGYEFQELCARIFEELGWGDAEIKKTRDEGRDIIIRSDTNLIIIECKHQPKARIGRPIVQKLHSATISCKGSLGMVVTTGRFTNDAKKFAGDITKDGVTINLVDISKLSEYAQRAGIDLKFGPGDESTIQYYPMCTTEEIENAMRITFNSYHSYPKTAIEIISLSLNSIGLRPAYIMKYSIYQQFNSATYHLHTINENNIPLAMWAHNGNIIEKNLMEFMMPSKLKNGKDSLNKINVPIERYDFLMTLENIYENARELLSDRYTKIISYTGRNNVNYDKKCVPNFNNIQFTDTKQVYLPMHNIQLHILNQTTFHEVITNGDNAEFTSKTLPKCSTCNKIANKIQICNNCGKLTHDRKIVFSHGYHCKNCKKTLCPHCTISTNQYLIFKKRQCAQCANKKI